jgi:hypothetical protein
MLAKHGPNGQLILHATNPCYEGCCKSYIICSESVVFCCLASFALANFPTINDASPASPGMVMYLATKCVEKIRSHV